MIDDKVNAEAVVDQLSRRVAQLEVQLAVRTVQLNELKARAEGVPKWLQEKSENLEKPDCQQNA